MIAAFLASIGSPIIKDVLTAVVAFCAVAGSLGAAFVYGKKSGATKAEAAAAQGEVSSLNTDIQREKAMATAQANGPETDDELDERLRDHTA